jgi:hypothetical protein
MIITRHNIFANSIPSPAPSDMLKWAEECIRVDGHQFDASRTPQIIEPIRAMFDHQTRTGTLIKPVQSGGSTAGEIVMAGWCRFKHGLIQFNWQDDLKAKDRWKDRLMGVLQTTPGLKWGVGRWDTTICEARFANAVLRVQGVISLGSLDSETVPLQLNEEVHLWEPGKLDKARRRQTRVWNGKAFDISNASDEGDQLCAAYEEGTMESWFTYCPGCKQYHKMQFRFDPKEPQLGGLKFDTNAGRVNNGPYNITRVVPTIHYVMPCGFTIRDSIKERRLPGKYIVGNEGAVKYKRSWNFDAVCCHEIKWPELVTEWLKAIRAKKGGDIEPLRKFVQERECRFWGEKSMPFSGQVIINRALAKNREGLGKDKAARFWAFDRQKGYKAKGETPHFWLVIRDVAVNADSQLVWEGLCQTEADVLGVLREHDCVLMQGAGDCTWDTENMRSFAYHSGFNALMATAQTQYFSVKDDAGKMVKRIWSETQPLHKLLNTRPKYDYVKFWNEQKKEMEYNPDSREPRYWSYHKIGILKLLFFLRSHYAKVGSQVGIRWEVPGDVSDDYKRHMGSWDVVVEPQGKSKQVVEQFRQLYQSDHMLQCEGYIAMLIAMSGILGRRLEMLGVQDTLLGGKEAK